ncbi:MAG: hypothetical protein KDD70_03095 [Bdellovibrionales bacterium]|nr:hypothetical protein [Bdellovibrionales bacterium]
MAKSEIGKWQAEELGYSLSFKERQAIRILVIEPEQELRQVIRNAVQSLGYGSVYCVSDHSLGLMRLEEDTFSHVFYAARSKTVDVLSFLDSVFSIDLNHFCIAVCENPEVDEIFCHLQRGTRGFITKPVTTEMIDYAILQATLGQAFSDTILNASDRNEAFSALMAATLNKVARARRQALRNPSAQGDLDRYFQDLKMVSELVRTFWDGGREVFMSRMIDFFIELSEGPATRLGSLRKKLREERKTILPVE